MMPADVKDYFFLGQKIQNVHLFSSFLCGSVKQKTHKNHLHARASR